MLIADNHLRSSAPTAGSAGTCIHTLSTGNAADGGADDVALQAAGFALDLRVLSEDLGWGPWEVVLPAAQVPEGVLSPSGRLLVRRLPLPCKFTPIDPRTEESSTCRLAVMPDSSA